MLTPDQAQQELNTRRIADPLDYALQAIAKLPDELYEPAHTLFRRHINENTLSAEALQEYNQALWRLEHLSASERSTVFACLFPKMAQYVELGWQRVKSLPYQRDAFRKPFRVTDASTIALRSSWHWLKGLVHHAGKYHEDILWFAQYAPHIHYGGGATELGILLSAVIDSGEPIGEEVFAILTASARGEHPVGAMGRHIPRALLSASRPDGWEFIEGLLLAAQREEGLRQVILETVDESHPVAFRRMVRLILDHDLVRFSAVTRAVDVWFGMGWQAAQTSQVRLLLAQALTLLEDPVARNQALAEGSGQQVYLALWALAFADAGAALTTAQPLLGDTDVARRFAAVRLLAQLKLIEARQTLLVALRDPDLRVVVQACEGFARVQHAELPLDGDLFEAVETVLARLPKPRSFEPLLWGWLRIEAQPEPIAAILVKALGDRPATRLIPHLKRLYPYDRKHAADLLAEAARDHPAARTALLKLTGDRSVDVRERVLALLAAQTIAPDEVHQLEALLTRKADDLRRGVLGLLVKQPDAGALAGADRLLAARSSAQRMAGLELLTLVAEQGRQVDGCARRAAAYAAAHPETDEVARALLDKLLANRVAPTLQDVLGLIDPAERTLATPPRPLRLPAPSQSRLRASLTRLGVTLRLWASDEEALQARIVEPVTPAALVGLLELDALIHTHRAAPVQMASWNGQAQERLLGDTVWAIPGPKDELPIDEDADRLPLRTIWETWVTERRAELRDADGLELVRMWLHMAQITAYRRSTYNASWRVEMETSSDFRYPAQLASVVAWLPRLFPMVGSDDFLLDCAEASLFELHRQAASEQGNYPLTALRSSMALHTVAMELARCLRDRAGAYWQPEQHARLWLLDRWIDEPVPVKRRQRPPLRDVLEVHRVGGATTADLYDHVLGAVEGAADGAQEDESQRIYIFHGHGRDTIRMLSGCKPHAYFADFPALAEVFAQCRRRILEVELARGEMPTAATKPALALRSVPGSVWFVRILQALGRTPLYRGAIYGSSEGRSAVLSHLLRVSLPTPDEDDAQAAAWIAGAHLSAQRLLEAAVFAPQWAAAIEQVMGWPGLADAIWWVYAHTKDAHWRIDPELRAAWQAQVGERTPLDAADLMAGAVDVAWFGRAFTRLGAERWEMVYAAAKYSAGGNGHVRAKLFADAMLGQIAQVALVQRITEKRHADSVRALGLLPLPDEGRDAEVLARYQILQEFSHGARQFGAQRQESERRAAQIGLENLARTAGYPDPLRLQWAMETAEVADLRQGPVAVTVDAVTVSLWVDELGHAQLDVTKAGKPLKAIPPAVKREPEVKALQARKTALTQQRSRMRLALEEAMCHGDYFTRTELANLLAHPVLASPLEDLVFVVDETDQAILGYPVQQGQALSTHYGRTQPLSPDAMLRIAHPFDLYRTGEWHLWQHGCFVDERIQPFKQIFRELYLLTAAEESDETVSRRYAGHQVQPRQAVALLTQRRWVVRPEEGMQRTFHREGLSVHLTFNMGFYSPADVEDLALEGVVFARPGAWWQPLRLVEVPPRLFSEVMRDLDLVVSVAHSGGVDPESTASTVEIRAALVRETCALLKLDNVSLQGRHVLIEGQLSSYSVHLSSGVVHRQPGGALCIVPMHAQQRGRIFVPFADDDPKTAEVLSKVLLLARDREVKDPTILEQILGRS